MQAALAAGENVAYVGEAEQGRPERARPVDEVRRFIHAHLRDPSLTLDDIAAAAHVTPAHMIRRFRAEEDVTPKASSGSAASRWASIS